LSTWKNNQKPLTLFFKVSLHTDIFHFSDGTTPPVGVLGRMDVSYILNKLNSVAMRIPIEDPWNADHAKWFDSITLETYLKKHTAWTQIGKTSIDLDIRTLFCCEPGEISALYALWFIHANQGLIPLFQAQHSTIVGGTVQILNCMLEEMKQTGNVTLVFDTPINKIEQHEDYVEVTNLTTQKTFKGRYCVCAIPPPLVPSIEFVPPLPPEHIALRQRMPMGNVIKTITRFSRPFWRENGFSGLSLSDKGPLCETYDYCDTDKGFYALIGFIAGNDCISWRQYNSDEERKNAILEQFKNLFESDEAYNATEHYEFDWNNEVFTRGGYFAGMTPGTLTKWGDQLRNPYGSVYFASTESATKWSGYMDGAIQSGRVVAEKIVVRL